MTPDIERMKLDVLSDLVDSLELALVEDPNWAEPSEPSYLRDSERANPDTMANVEAMVATNGCAEA